MKDEMLDVSKMEISGEGDFEKLILAYDYSTRRSSKYRIAEEDALMIENGSYRYPALKFVRRGV